MTETWFHTRSNVGPSWIRTGKGDRRTDPAPSDQSLSLHDALKVPTAYMGGLLGSGQDPACEFIIDGRGCCVNSSWMAKRKQDLYSYHHLVSILTWVLQDKGVGNITSSFGGGMARSLWDINRKYFSINATWLINFSEILCHIVQYTVHYGANSTPPREGWRNLSLDSTHIILPQAVTLCRSLTKPHTPQHCVMKIRKVSGPCYFLISLIEK